MHLYRAAVAFFAKNMKERLAFFASGARYSGPFEDKRWGMPIICRPSADA